VLELRSGRAQAAGPGEERAVDEREAVRPGRGLCQSREQLGPGAADDVVQAHDHAAQLRGEYR
jgi:hypothetical protein